MSSPPGTAVEEFADAQEIDVAAGQPFAVLLSGNGAGGYRWRVAELPAPVAIRGEDDVAPARGAPGATGVKRFELEAREAGTFTLRFELVRDWEPGPADARELTLRVRAGP